MKRYRRFILCGLMLGLWLLLGRLNTATSLATPPESAVALVTGSIGGYNESVTGVALAVEATGRIHVLWSGKLNPNFVNFVFYSTSTDGLHWTPYQILDYWYAGNPALAVDNAHQRVHIIYSNLYDGIMHRVAVNGVPGAATVVVPRREYYQPGLSLPSGGQLSPDIAVAEDTGYAHLVWQEGYYQRTDEITYAFRRRAWYAYWDGVKWSAPQQKINDLDTAYVSIAATPDERLMLAWFQRWDQSAGDAVSPGDPIVPRTAYGETPGRFPLRQASHALYPQPERDESIVLTYSAGDDAFVLSTSHFMWPGHSRIYRYLWQDGAWSEPVSVAGNTSGWAGPAYVGAAEDTSLIRYIYSDNYVLKMRTETNGALSTAQPVADYLAARGYTGSPLAYFTHRAGNLHMAVAGEKESVPGFYYVRP